MKKIETMFVREGKGRAFAAINRVAPGCEWVAAGEGVATRKWDGSCCLVRAGKLYKRIEWAAEKGPAPASWFHHDDDPAQRSGHGWMPVTDDPGDTWHRDAWSRVVGTLPDGTYELCGPRVGKNREGFTEHVLVPHGEARIENAPRDFDGLREFMRDFPHEGIVFHHPDGRMAKIKRSDFHR
jgi:hypothetical protein